MAARSIAVHGVEDTNDFAAFNIHIRHEHRGANVFARLVDGARHNDLEGGAVGTGNHPLAAVDDIAVVVFNRGDFHHRGVGARTAVWLGHREGRADVGRSEGAEILFLLLFAAHDFQQMHIAFVRGRDIERVGAERRVTGFFEDDGFADMR